MFEKIKQHKLIILKSILLCVVLWTLIGYILVPTLKTVVLSLQGTNGLSLEHYITFFEGEVQGVVVRNTVVLGLATVVVCGIIGTTLAFLMSYFEFPGKKVLSKLLLTPIMVPGIIIVLAFLQLYGESGMVTKAIESLFRMETIPFKLSGFWGILFIHAYTQYVYFFMNVSLAIKHIDYSVVEAAKNLGASPYQVFRTIIFPFIKPALIASSLVTFITAIGSFTAPNLIGDGYKVLTTQMLFAKSNNRMDIASVQVVILMLMAMTFLLLCRYYERKNAFSGAVKGVPIQPIPIENPIIKWSCLVAGFGLIGFVLLPVVTIFILSFVTPGSWLVEIFPTDYSLENYIRILTKKRTLAPFLNSMTMSVIAVTIATIISVLSSYIIVKTKSHLKVIVEVLAMLPLAIPASAIAINLINSFKAPSVFAFNQTLLGSYVILPIAYSIIILPLILRSTNLSMYQLNDAYEEASLSLGASFTYTFRKVMIPIIRPGILSGAAIGLIKCIGEYTSSAYLYTVQNKPVSIGMVNGVFEYEIGLAMAYGVLVILVTMLLSLYLYRD